MNRKFFEFNKPYYAIVAASSEDNASQIYQKNVADLDCNEPAPNEVSLNYVKEKCAAIYSGIGVELDQWIESADILLMDASLI